MPDTSSERPKGTAGGMTPLVCAWKCLGQVTVAARTDGAAPQHLRCGSSIKLRPRVPSPASARSSTTFATCRWPAARRHHGQGRTRCTPNTGTGHRLLRAGAHRPEHSHHTRSRRWARQPRFTRSRTFASGSNSGSGGPFQQATTPVARQNSHQQGSDTVDPCRTTWRLTFESWLCRSRILPGRL